jgi:hypothetical protein
MASLLSSSGRDGKTDERGVRSNPWKPMLRSASLTPAGDR